jgi:general stress protein 26
MNSIDQQQPEQNTKDLHSTEAIERMQEMVKGASSCFFCTAVATGPTFATRPMSVQKIDDEGNLWFLSAVDSHKNQEIGQEPAVKLFFQGSAHSDFLYLEGTATISKDPNMIEELWEPIVKTWFTEGKDDPRITVIKVTPSAGYYWDNKHGNLVAGAKMMFGAMVGKTYDDSIQGTIRP